MPLRSLVATGLRAAALGLTLSLALVPLRARAAPDTAHTFDVEGVTLGMTRDEAVSALKKFDPQGTFQEPHGTPYALPPHDIWTKTPNLIFLSRDFHDIDALPSEEKQLLAICGYATSACKAGDHAQFSAILEKVLAAPRVVTVWLSPVPGKETVIAVSSTTKFVKPIPTAAELQAAIEKRYTGQPSSIANDGSGPVIRWMFDARGRPASKTEAAHVTQSGFFWLNPVTNRAYSCPYGKVDGVRGGICPAVYLPSPVRQGDGVALLAWIRQGQVGVCKDTPTTLPMSSCPDWHVNKLLADQVVFMLYDSTALAKFGAELRASKALREQRQNATEADKTKGSLPKF